MTTLATALESSDMLLIDGLHAFDFTFDAKGLLVECMDGRDLKRWKFTAEQVAAAVGAGDEWRLNDDQGEHQLVCMSAVSASDDDEDDYDDEEPDLEAPAER
ncbi:MULTISPECIES: DUF5629 family protein [Pseudomonas]|uniref:Uncharacterized protein n=1 Tax=Pseudomonas hunanensis TaxID=1247546 RepID=A0ACC6K7H4_9PSED|nr:MULTISPECIES: DUF5629 family protein [Pseudomonas]MBP2263467.1 hypothetical protein [Pseudomonas sp. BP8]MDR6714377.1 hypothetical protein [Pseudomonas hunanensis]HDS1736953.1 DUF5629 family protein [Pseudomonas putida]